MAQEKHGNPSFEVGFMDKLQGKRVGLEQTLIKLCIWYVYGLIPILKGFLKKFKIGL